MNNNGSDSDKAKQKISFDINNVKENHNESSESSSAAMPVFSINNKKKQTEDVASEAGMAKKEVATSKAPVFEIHDNATSIGSSESSSFAVSKPETAATSSEPVTPQITVQSKIPASSASQAGEDEPALSLAQIVNDEESAADSAPSMSQVEINNSQIEAANLKLAKELEELEKQIKANSVSAESAAAEASQADSSTTPESSEPAQSAQTSNVASQRSAGPLTREAYRSSLTSAESEESQSGKPATSAQTSQVSRPRPPRPKKEAVEKVEPLFASEEKKESQPKVKWNGPNVESSQSQGEHKKTAYHETPSRTTSHHSHHSAKRKPQKESGVLGKSFLAMLGLGNKDK